MRQVNIAMGLLQQGDGYLLQLRKGDPKIGAAGFIGCFGGKINQGEDPLATFCREILEETNLRIDSKDVRKLGIVEVESDNNLEPVKVKGHVFHYNLKKSDLAKINEGELVVMTDVEIRASLDKLTPATKAVFTEIF